MWKLHPDSEGKHHDQLAMSSLSAKEAGKRHACYLPALDIRQPEGKIERYGLAQDRCSPTLKDSKFLFKQPHSMLYIA